MYVCMYEHNLFIERNNFLDGSDCIISFFRLKINFIVLYYVLIWLVLVVQSNGITYQLTSILMYIICILMYFLCTYSYFTRHFCTLHFYCECVGQTPLHYAAEDGHADVLRVLLNSPNNGIDLQVMNSNLFFVFSILCKHF